MSPTNDRRSSRHRRPFDWRAQVAGYLLALTGGLVINNFPGSGARAVGGAAVITAVWLCARWLQAYRQTRLYHLAEWVFLGTAAVAAGWSAFADGVVALVALGVAGLGTGAAVLLATNLPTAMYLVVAAASIGSGVGQFGFAR